MNQIESPSPQDVDQTKPPKQEGFRLQTQQFVGTAIGALSVAIAALLVRRWSRGVWDFTHAASLSLFIIALTLFNNVRQQKRFTLASAMWMVMLLSIGFAGLGYSMQWTAAREKRMEEAREQLQSMISIDGVFIQNNGDITCMIESPDFSIRELQQVLQLINESPDINLAFLGMYTSQAGDDWLEAIGSRPRLRRALVDGRLVTEEAIARFQQKNPRCEIDLNVVAQ